MAGLRWALVVALAAALALLRTSPLAEAQVFCRSQFMLANEACALRPYQETDGFDSEMDAGGELTRRTRRRDNGTAAAVPGDEDEEEDDDGNEVSNRPRRSRQYHSYDHSDNGGDPEDSACCRRLMGVDNACICQMMSRLPKFITKHRHVLTLTPVDGCDISYDCVGL